MIETIKAVPLINVYTFVMKIRYAKIQQTLEISIGL